MPAKSKSQRRLMAYAYACKTGKAKNCPQNVMKVGKGMTTSQLKDFFEGIIYKTKKVDRGLLTNFLVWLDERNIEYIYDELTSELEIYNEFALSKEDNQALLQYASKLGLEKIWESNFISEFNADMGTNYANLGNTIGQGSVRPAATISSNGGSGSEPTGSGDRFDNFEDEDDDDDDAKKLKRKKKLSKIEQFKKSQKNQLHNNINTQKGKMESIFISLEKFEDLIDERLVAKRKYTEKHPSVDVNYKAPIRNKILSFIEEGTEISEEKLKEFFNSLEEELGSKPNFEWIKRNRHLVKKFEKDSGSFYKLTERGQKVLKHIKDYESKNKDIE